jgi:hypothetical protein
LTSRALRGAWKEKSVRIWWLMAIVIFLIAAWYAGSRTWRWNREKWLLQHGVKVEAEVLGWTKVEPRFIEEDIVHAGAAKGHTAKTDAAVMLRYTYNGKRIYQFGTLDGRKEPVTIQVTTEDMKKDVKKWGHVVPVYVRIDPSNPDNWTGRTEKGDLLSELVVPALLLPLSVVLMALAVVKRRQILGVYRDGEPVLAEVVAVGHSAAAPLSRLLRCAVDVDGDHRVVKAILPTRLTPPAGQLLWLIAPAGKPEAGVPAVLFL